MTLALLPTVHDLPPSWDGQPVTWQGWRTVTSTYALHVPPADSACTSCRVIDTTTLCNTGIINPTPGETFDLDVVRTLPSGRTYSRGTRAVPAWPVVRFVAFRCPCGLDQVHDEHTGETWDLEPADYHGTGSVAAGVLW